MRKNGNLTDVGDLFEIVDTSQFCTSIAREKSMNRFCNVIKNVSIIMATN